MWQCLKKERSKEECFYKDRRNYVVCLWDLFGREEKLTMQERKERNFWSDISKEVRGDEVYELVERLALGAQTVVL